MTPRKREAGNPAKSAGPEGSTHQENSTDAAASNSSSLAIDVARACALLGFRVVPTNGKIATTNGFGAENPDFTCGPEWFGEPGTRAAILCGPCPALGQDWLICLDVDGDPSNNPAMATFLASLPPTLTSHAGRHLFYRVLATDAPRLGQWGLFKRPGFKHDGIDLKWAGGYVCERGDWDGPFEVERIAILPEGALAEILAKHERTAKVISLAEGGPEWLSAKGLDPAKVLEWAIEYLQEDAPLPAEGKGGATMMVVCGALRAGYGLDDATALELVRDVYAPRAWPTEEPDVKGFAHKIDEVNAKGSEAFYPLQLARRDQFAESCKIHASANDNATSVRAESTTAKWSLLTGDQLLEPLGPVNWLVEGLEIAPGAPSVWAGYGFSGKTLAAQALAVAVATGSTLWGLDVRQGRVLYLDYEQGRRLTCDRFQRLLFARGMSDFAGNLDVGILPPFRLDPKLEQAFTEMCRGYALIVVDSLRAAAPGELEENNSEIRSPLDMLTRVSEATGASAVVIHHARKPSKDTAGGSKMSLRGSGAIFDACSSVFVFAGEKDCPTNVSHEKARISGVPRNDFKLAFEDVTLAGGRGLRVSMVEVAGEVHVPEALRQRQAHVLKVVGDHMGCSRNVIELEVPGKATDTRRATDALVAAGQLFNGGTDSRPAYFLRPADEVVFDLICSTVTGMTAAQIMKRTQLKAKAVQTHLAMLQSERKIVRVSSDADPFYQVIPG